MPLSNLGKDLLPAFSLTPLPQNPACNNHTTNGTKWTKVFLRLLPLEWEFLASKDELKRSHKPSEIIFKFMQSMHICSLGKRVHSFNQLLRGIQFPRIIAPRLLCCCCSVVSNSLQYNGLQHASLPCPSLSPRVCSNSHPVIWCCHLTIWFSITTFSCLQSFPASGSLQWVNSSHQVAKLLELQLQHQSFQWILKVDFL